MFIGKPRGFAGTVYGNWCNRDLKIPALQIANKEKGIYYIGIAADEPNRFGQLSDTKKYPLVEAGWDEHIAANGAKKTTCSARFTPPQTRGGCWFCTIKELDSCDYSEKTTPDLWALMLKWDEDSPVTFKADGHTRPRL